MGAKITSSVKPMSAWLCDKTVTVCRERIGGVGFLLANGFGGMFAHAGITAEGDARVLWMKVAKEFLDLVTKQKFSRLDELQVDATCPNITVPTTVEDFLKLLGSLRALFANRVMFKSNKLAELIQKTAGEASAEHPLREQLFDATMYKYSDETQQVAEAYANWEALRSFMLVLDSRGAAPDLTHNGPKGTRLSDDTMMALCRLCLLFALESLHTDAAEMIHAGKMTAVQVITCKAVMGHLCTDIRPDVMSLIRGFNLQEEVIFAPIAKDWKTYNECDNFGEIVDTGRFGTNKA